MALDWSSVRSEFPVLEDWTYLNAATFGPVPQRAVEAIEQHFRDRNETASLDFLSWFDDADAVRAQAARLLGGEPQDIGFLPSAGIGLSWVMEGMGWRPGDRILTIDHEFPNNIYSPLSLAGRGVESVTVPGGLEFTPEAMIGAIDERVRVTLVSALSYSSGLRPPLERIGRAVRAAGGLFVVDGTQGLGAIDINVARDHADVVLAHGYKWMCCPPGAGFLYMSERARRAIRPTVVSWRSHKDWRNVNALHHGAPEPADEGAQYEGGILNFSGIAAMGAVLDLFEQVGKETLWARVAELSERTRQVLREAGGEPSFDASPWFDSPVVTARFPGRDVGELALRLREKRIALAARQGFLRVSPHFYNNEEDLAALRDALMA
ncbi:MAG: aminotransferase class V-fold PLP-dependent enzyme [Acidobacteria bacterium]|nr:aminotransferase class V-fold PLP-dependent enzyme [Acidobacteriota bacterium]